MNKIALVTTAFSVVLLTSTLSRAESTIPCEDALKALRALESTAKISDADKAEVSKLEAQGIERCNADDDKRADEFFAQATKLLTK